MVMDDATAMAKNVNGRQWTMVAPHPEPQMIKETTYNLLLHSSCKYFKNEWGNGNGRKKRPIFQRLG